MESCGSTQLTGSTELDQITVATVRKAASGEQEQTSGVGYSHKTLRKGACNCVVFFITQVS